MKIDKLGNKVVGFGVDSFISGWFGQYIAPKFSATAAGIAAEAAGAPILSACVLGSVFVAVPYLFLKQSLDGQKNNIGNFSHFVLDTALSASAMFGAGYVGATLLGLAGAVTIGSCAAIGAIAWAVAGALLSATLACLGLVGVVALAAKSAPELFRTTASCH